MSLSHGSTRKGPLVTTVRISAGFSVGDDLGSQKCYSEETKRKADAAMERRKIKVLRMAEWSKYRLMQKLANGVLPAPVAKLARNDAKNAPYFERFERWLADGHTLVPA